MKNQLSWQKGFNNTRLNKCFPSSGSLCSSRVLLTMLLSASILVLTTNSKVLTLTAKKARYLAFDEWKGYRIEHGQKSAWSDVNTFLENCDELDGSEQTLNTSFFEDLKPLFSSPLPTYQKIAEILQLYDASKSSNESMKATCYPWTVPTGLNNPEIAMLLVTSGYNDSDWQLSITDKIQYAKQHGYDLHMFNESVGGRFPPWTKIPAALSLMDSYDWIFGIDMDTIILNHSISLESFLDPSPKVIFNVDIHGLNTGVNLMKACSWTKMLLIDAWTHSDVEMSDTHWERAAITFQMNNYLLRNRAKFVPQKLFNQYPKDGEVSAEDTFIVHFAGRSDKLDQVRKYFDRRVAVMEDSHIIRSEDID